MNADEFAAARGGGTTTFDPFQDFRIGMQSRVRIPNCGYSILCAGKPSTRKGDGLDSLEIAAGNNEADGGGRE